jgi:hypothetical protein
VGVCLPFLVFHILLVALLFASFVYIFSVVFLKKSINAEFYADFRTVEKLAKKCTHKKL